MQYVRGRAVCGYVVKSGDASTLDFSQYLQLRRALLCTNTIKAIATRHHTHYTTAIPSATVVQQVFVLLL